MKENISSPELTLNIWSNDACRGYVIMAMQDCGFTHKDISRVVNVKYRFTEFFLHIYSTACNHPKWSSCRIGCQPFPFSKNQPKMPDI